jgi:hypothetical protein
MGKRTAVWGAVFCFCFFAAVLWSETFIVTHEHHDCYGEGCPVCLQIQGARNFSRLLKAAPFQTVSSPGTFLIVPIISKNTFFAPVPLSAVALKVKMNR